jgi:3-deoxy-D-manno-octulosonate 8-phosphate phosphatase (KDO 8-P phosphatase)
MFATASMKLEQRMQSVRLILSDVDGVLTDGGISYDNQGIEIKKFHVRDGLGIKLWQQAGHKFGVLTARNSHIVKVRASELGVAIIRQGFTDKLPVAMQIIEENQLKPENVCYIGDDLPDLPVIRSVGLGVAVANAVNEVRSAAHYTTKTQGGQGAVRELIELILTTQKRWSELLAQY